MLHEYRRLHIVLLTDCAEAAVSDTLMRRFAHPVVIKSDVKEILCCPFFCFDIERYMGDAPQRVRLKRHVLLMQCFGHLAERGTSTLTVFPVTANQV